MSYAEAIQSLYDAESALQIIAQAVEGEQITGVSITKLGGCRMIELVSEQVGQAIEALEKAPTARA